MPCLYTLYLTVSTHGKYHGVLRLSRQVEVLPYRGESPQKATSRHAVNNPDLFYPCCVRCCRRHLLVPGCCEPGRWATIMVNARQPLFPRIWRRCTSDPALEANGPIESSKLRQACQSYPFLVFRTCRLPDVPESARGVPSIPCEKRESGSLVISGGIILRPSDSSRGLIAVLRISDVH